MGMLWPTLELMLGCAVVLVFWLGGREVLRDKIECHWFRIWEPRPRLCSPAP